MRRPGLVWTFAVLVMGAALTGCGDRGEVPDPPPVDLPTRGPDARAQLAARAAAAQERVGVSRYTLTGEAEGARSVRVVYARDGSWRVDIDGAALGGTVDVTIAEIDQHLYYCAAMPAAARPPCLPMDTLPPPADPRIQLVFTDWRAVLTDRAAPVSVATAPPPVSGVGGDCFGVQLRAASLPAPVDPGVYCFDEDGTLTAAQLELGTLALVETDSAAPPTVELPGPLGNGEPLPTATPSPTLTPPTPPVGSA